MKRSVLAQWALALLAHVISQFDVTGSTLHREWNHQARYVAISYGQAGQV
jgi:hypothetical protein